MTLLVLMVRCDARRPAIWLATIGAAFVAWRLAAAPASGTAVAVAWMAGSALVVAAIGTPLVAPAGTLVRADTWATLRALWPVAGMLAGATAAIASASAFGDASLVLLSMLAGALGAVRCRVVVASRVVSEADCVSLALALPGAAALAGWTVVPAAAPAWGVILAVACAWWGLWAVLATTEDGRRSGRRVCSPLVRVSATSHATALVAPLRRLLVAASMVVSLAGMVAWLFLVADAAPIAGWVALACFVAIAVPPALLPDAVLCPALGRMLASVPAVAHAVPAWGRVSPGTTAAWWHAAILAWPPLVAALLHLREPSRALAALAVAAVPAMAAVATSIVGSGRVVTAAADTRLATLIVAATVLAAAALDH